MTSILVCGLCPLPFENTLRSFGPGIRTWQFARSLAAAGHRVQLLAMEIPGSYEDDAPERNERRDGVDVERLDDQEFFDRARLEARIGELRPDAVVGATIYGSHVLALTRPEIPFWADQFGHVMAEAQAKAYLEGENWPLQHFWKLLEPVLQRADRLSAVSHRQRFASIGELGMMGRLTSETCGYEFTAVIPCAMVPGDDAPLHPVLRGSEIPEDAFVVLSSGGYNVWTDVATLFEGLEIALEKEPRIHFVSTGGAIEGHDESTYRDFQGRIEGSRYRDRYHLQGWVRADLVPSIQAEADLGVVAEAPIYEGRLGSKNRIVQWMGAGLPVLYNRMGDLGALLADKDLGLTFEIGDAATMAKRILWAAENPRALRRLERRARRYTLEELSFEATTRELVSWAENPERAPDAGGKPASPDARQAVRPPAEDDVAPKPETMPAPDPVQEDPIWQPPPDDDLPAVENGGVCAVIVHHRGEAMLGRCLESLLASAGVELQVVVVENACQEPLPEIARTSRRVHAVTSEVSLGFSAANNLGVDWAREHLGDADYYYFINNDTESTAGALARLAGALERRAEAAMAGPTLLILDAGDHYNSLGINVTEDGWGWDEAIGLEIADYGPPPASRPVLAVTGSALLIDAAVFHQIGGWTEVYEYYFEDIDLGVKVWKAEREVIHVPDAVVRHQISATMTDGSERKNFLFWRNRLMLTVVHWPMSLLLRTFRRAIFGELLDRHRTDRPVLRRALRETLARLPALLRCRRRWRGDDAWRRFLVPPGSVPVITLPEIGGDAGDPAADAEGTGDATAESAGDPTATGGDQPVRDEPEDRILPRPRPFASPPADDDSAETDIRAQLESARQRAERAEVSDAEARRALHQIHTSKMWRLWMAYLSVRRWLLRPFGAPRRS